MTRSGEQQISENFGSYKQNSLKTVSIPPTVCYYKSLECVPAGREGACLVVGVSHWGLQKIFQIKAQVFMSVFPCKTRAVVVKPCLRHGNGVVALIQHLYSIQVSSKKHSQNILRKLIYFYIFLRF